MDSKILKELETLTEKIELNSANLDDYQRYELLLSKGGLSHDRIYSYLHRAGFNDWEEFSKARSNKIKNKKIEGGIIGGLIGLGIGLLIAALFED